MRAQALVKVYDQALKDAQERLHQGQLELSQLQVAKVDVSRLDAAVAQAQSDLLVAQNNLQLSKYALNLVLARPIETPVEVQDVAKLPDAPSDATDLVNAAKSKRPEVLALRETLRALAYIRRATESSMDPSLALSISQARNIDAQGLGTQSTSNTAAISLSIPIFDSGVTRAKVKQARQNEAQAAIQLEQEELGISQEVRSAMASLQSSASRLQNADRQLALAEEVYRLSVIRQQSGEGTYVDIIDAETTLTQARNGQVSAKYDYLTAFSQLQRALGSDNLGADTTKLRQGGN